MFGLKNSVHPVQRVAVEPGNCCEKELDVFIKIPVKPNAYCQGAVVIASVPQTRIFPLAGFVKYASSAAGS